LIVGFVLLTSNLKNRHLSSHSFLTNLPHHLTQAIHLASLCFSRRTFYQLYQAEQVT